MKSIKVEGRLVNDSGGIRVRHKNRLRTIILFILVSVVCFLGARQYIIYELNSEEFFNAHATIEQLSKQYGYVDGYSLTLEERLELEDDVTYGRLNKVYYLDRRELNKEDYLKYEEVRDYYVYIMYTPYKLTLLCTLLIMFLIMYSIYAIVKSFN